MAIYLVGGLYFDVKTTAKYIQYWMIC